MLSKFSTLHFYIKEKAPLIATIYTPLTTASNAVLQTDLEQQTVSSALHLTQVDSGDEMSLISIMMVSLQDFLLPVRHRAKPKKCCFFLFYH